MKQQTAQKTKTSAAEKGKPKSLQSAIPPKVKHYDFESAIAQVFKTKLIQRFFVRKFSSMLKDAKDPNIAFESFESFHKALDPGQISALNDYNMPAYIEMLDFIWDRVGWQGIAKLKRDQFQTLGTYFTYKDGMSVLRFIFDAREGDDKDSLVGWSRLLQLPARTTLKNLSFFAKHLDELRIVLQKVGINALQNLSFEEIKKRYFKYLSRV